MPQCESAEHVNTLGTADRLSGLREDVVRECVIINGPALVYVDPAITRRTKFLKRRSADLLRGYADPDAARTHVLPYKEPHLLRIESVRDVVPLDQNGAIEPFGVGGAADDKARLVWMIAVDNSARRLGGRVL
jgi:hypothetical protein